MTSFLSLKDLTQDVCTYTCAWAAHKKLFKSSWQILYMRSTCACCSDDHTIVDVVYPSDDDCTSSLEHAVLSVLMKASHSYHRGGTLQLSCNCDEYQVTVNLNVDQQSITSIHYLGLDFDGPETRGITTDRSSPTEADVEDVLEQLEMPLLEWLLALKVIREPKMPRIFQ